ncbi:MAG: hydantoinase/oxoprolinase family protein [Chloroflexota bacterium]
MDIGGTFTDIVLLGSDASIVITKVASTPDNYGRGIVDGLGEMLREKGLPAAALTEVVHGTTVATNAILEGRGATTALITTAGFRDVLEFRRIRIPELYDLFYQKPAPLVPRRRRFEVVERLGSHGEVRQELDPASVRAAVEGVRASGAEAVAICLLHSFVNPAHERAVEAAVRSALPEIYVTSSFNLLPEIREYERTSTTVINSYVGPVVERYLRALSHDLAAAGVDAPLLVMQSNGAIMTADLASERPAHIIESGPAAGVTAAAQLSRTAGYPNVITFDMGGTTAKASMVEDGRLSQTSEYEVGGGVNLSSQLVKGGGYALKLPLIDISEIGAGGGSVIWIDQGNLLQIGPHSAGALPGPVCYDTGGEDPTVTDANVVLGYLNPEYLAGGRVRLNAQKAACVLEQRIAKPLDMLLAEAAFGVFTLATNNMVRAVKAVSTYRGRDPRDFALLAFGGNGPVFGAEMARALQMATVIVPPAPGLFSAFGLLLSDIEHHFVRTLFRPTASLDVTELMAAFGALEDQARLALRREGYARDVIVRRFADLRYTGQAYELTVDVPGGPITSQQVREMAGAFGEEHMRTYGHRAEDEPVDLVNIRVVGSAPPRGSRTYHPESALSISAAREHRASSARTAYFGRAVGAVETPVIGRSDLVGAARSGPLIIEEYDATCVVPPGCAASLDAHANIVIQVA